MKKIQKIIALLELWLRNRWQLKYIVPYKDHKENNVETDTESKRGSLSNWIEGLSLLG